MTISYVADRMVQQLNLPNYLSLSRVVAGLTLPLWWQFDSWATVFIIMLVGLTDGLDGWTARAFKQQTPLGRELDPLADKVFTLMALFYITLATMNPFVAVLAGVTCLYDIDNTWRRRLDISLACKNVPITHVDLPVGKLSKFKTATLFVIVGLLVFTGTSELVPWVSAAATLLVIASWCNHRVIRGHYFRSRYAR